MTDLFKRAATLQMSVSMQSVIRMVKDLQRDSYVSDDIRAIASNSLMDFVEAMDANQIDFKTPEGGGAALGLATIAAIVVLDGAKLIDREEMEH